MVLYFRWVISTAHVSLWTSVSLKLINHKINVLWVVEVNNGIDMHAYIHERKPPPPPCDNCTVMWRGCLACVSSNVTMATSVRRMRNLATSPLFYFMPQRAFTSVNILAHCEKESCFGSVFTFWFWLHYLWDHSVSLIEWTSISWWVDVLVGLWISICVEIDFFVDNIFWKFKFG